MEICKTCGIGWVIKGSDLGVCVQCAEQRIINAEKTAELESKDCEILQKDIVSLRSALAEKTAQVEAHKYALGQVTIQRDEARRQVERLREALDDLVDMCETEFVFGGPPACDFELMVLPSAREALAATAPKEDLDA